MSSYNRKLRKNREAKTLVIDMREDTAKVSSSSDMVDVFEQYGLSFDFTVTLLMIEVSSYNKKINTNGYTLINSYGLVFKDFIESCNMKKRRCRMEEFFKDSVENNPTLCDIFHELDFTIKDNTIISTYEGVEEESICFGEFYVDNYKVHASGSTLYCEDILSGKKFMYYAD